MLGSQHAQGPKGQKRPADVVALCTVWYNWVRIHKKLRVTPAMSAGLTDKLLSMEDVAAMIDAVAATPVRPATYKKQPQISN